MGKILFKQSNGLISVACTLLRRKQLLRCGILTLNAIGQTQMMLKVQVTQIRQVSWKTPKNSTNSKLHEIAEDLKISEGRVFTILHEHLLMCLKWVPRFLTVDQKQQQHVDDSECCLQLFQRNKKEILHKYVTRDETWIYHFTPKSNL